MDMVTTPSVRLPLKRSLITIAVLCCSTSALAAQKPITGTLSAAPSKGTKVLAISDSGKSATGTISKGKFSVVPADSTARLYLLKGGKITGQIVLSKCKGSAKNPKSCSVTQVYTVFKSGKALGKLSKAGKAYVVKAVSLGSVVSSSKVAAQRSVPEGLASNGLGGTLKAARVLNRYVSVAASSTADVDGDGLVEAVDVDDNNNGVIDNYDTTPVTQPTNTFRIFSNFKLSIEESLNLHATGLSTVLVDTAMQKVQTLAIGVAGTTGETTELDCGGLTYCSAGGTGAAPPESGTAFPGTAGSSLDPDGDGYGTITKGATGDFQLRTNASSSAIAAGDTLIERVAGADGVERQIPGILNFVFTSTPAIKSFAVNGGAETTIDYTVANRFGSMDRCILVPATGTVAFTVTGWRPQRPGVAAAGEGSYVDLGNSKITIDIPNSPVPTSGSGGGAGPGNCAVSAYSESDPNLSTGGDSLQDNKGDVDASSSNTYQFTVDVTSCLATGRGGPITWNAGEKLSIEVQFRSQDGDNASQRICLMRNDPI